MLGDLIYEARDKVTGKRVLDTEGPTIEGTYQTQGKLKGMEVIEMGTFSSTMRPGGALYGEDKAVVMTRDGDGKPKRHWALYGAGSRQLEGMCAVQRQCDRQALVSEQHGVRL